MSSVVAPLAIPATLQLPDLDIELACDVEHTLTGEGVVLGAVRLNGTEIELSEIDRIKLAAVVATLYEDNGDRQDNG